MMEFDTATAEAWAWQERAACRNVTPETMQPEVATDAGVRAAKGICGRGTPDECPVLLQCKALAESQAMPYGIHAGQWYGPNPATADTCNWCGVELEDTTSHKRRFCGGTCQKRASRAAAVAENSAA